MTKSKGAEWRCDIESLFKEAAADSYALKTPFALTYSIIASTAEKAVKTKNMDLMLLLARLGVLRKDVEEEYPFYTDKEIIDYCNGDVEGKVNIK